MPMMQQAFQSIMPPTKNSKRIELLLSVCLIQTVSLAAMLGTTVGLFR